MASVPPGGPLIVRESAGQRDGLFAFLTLVFAAALVRGLLGARTTGGQVAVAVIMVGVLVLVVVLWMSRRGAAESLEIPADSITLRRPKTDGDQVLRPAAGSRLRFTSVG